MSAVMLNPDDSQELPRVKTATDPLRAIIFVLAGPRAERDKTACVRECQREGCDIVAVVVDASRDGTCRLDVIRMLHQRQADVVVVADPEVFAGGGVPRLIVALPPWRVRRSGIRPGRRPQVMR